MKRFEWIDTLKGIGIVCVVAGHIYGAEIREFIFIFHIPLFFFIGGFLYSYKQKNHDYLKSKIIHLIVPYVFFIIIIYPIQLFTMLPPNSSFNLLNICKLILNPISGGHNLWGLTSTFWFATCFFITQQIANFLIKNVKEKKKIIVAIIFMLILSYINSLFIRQFWLPQNAHVALASVPLFLFGFLFREQYSKSKLESNYYLISLPLLFISLLIVIFYPQDHSNQWFFIGYDMKHFRYGIPIISLLLALGLILLCIDFSKFIIYRLNYLGKILGKLGEASMVIMYVHMLFIYILKHGFKTLNIGTSLSLFNILILSTLFSFLVYKFLSRFSLTRALFLGVPSDFVKLFPQTRK